MIVVVELFIISLVFGYLIWCSISDTARADELPELPETENLSLWEEEKCKNCKLFDKYDVCLARKHWGSVIQNTIEYCKKENSYEPIKKI